jgi:hypothetical protein
MTFESDKRVNIDQKKKIWTPPTAKIESLNSVKAEASLNIKDLALENNYSKYSTPMLEP